MKEFLKKCQDKLFSKDHSGFLVRVASDILENQLLAAKADIATTQFRLLEYLRALPRRTAAEERLLNTLSGLSESQQERSKQQ